MRTGLCASAQRCASATAPRCALARLIERAVDCRMAEQKHLGGCHCGKVRYEATVDLDSEVMARNCSMCRRKGTLLTFSAPTNSSCSRTKGISPITSSTRSTFITFFARPAASPLLQPIFAAETPMKTGQPMIAVNAHCLDRRGSQNARNQAFRRQKPLIHLCPAYDSG